MILKRLEELGLGAHGLVPISRWTRDKNLTTAQLTDDWAVRGRVNCATTLISPLGPVDLLALTQALSEFSVPQRGWLAASGFDGVLPRHVLTVENLSPLVDLTLPADTMVLFCQGAAVEGTVQLLRELPGAAWMHFGDLDAAGVQIAARIAHLTGRSPSLQRRIRFCVQQRSVCFTVIQAASLHNACRVIYRTLEIVVIQRLESGAGLHPRHKAMPVNPAAF